MGDNPIEPFSLQLKTIQHLLRRRATISSIRRKVDAFKSSIEKLETTAPPVVHR